MKYTVSYFAVAALLIAGISAEDPWTPSPLCPFPSTDQVRFQYEGNCTKYWECYNGARYPMDCPTGLHFNAAESRCDAPEIANCDPDATIIYPTFPHSTVSTPSPTPTEDLGPKPTCPFPSNELIFFPVVNNCAKYWECFQGIRYLMSCPPNLYWNTEFNYCDHAVNVDCSRNNATTTPIPTPGSNSTTTPGGVTPDSQCPLPGNEITFFPHPTECNRYYECHLGNKYIMTCPEGLYWNEWETACDYRENVNCDRANSTTTPRPSTPGSNTTTTPGGNTPECPLPGYEITFYPHPTECSKYYECHLGNLYVMSCPADLYWNERENACDYKENVNCDRVTTPSSSPTTSTSITSTNTTSTTINPICAGVPDGTYLPNPNDCSRYYECVGGKIAADEQCPGDTLWNHIILTCDYPTNVNCNRV